MKISRTTFLVFYSVWFVLFVCGFIGRESALFVAILVYIFAVFSPIDEATLLFIQLIPLGFAIPLTDGYDRLSLWRIFSLILLARASFYFGRPIIKSFISGPKLWLKKHIGFALVALIFILSVASLVGSSHPITGIVKIIYFVNLSFAPFVVALLVRRQIIKISDIATSMIFPLATIVVVGIIQLASVFYFDIYQFMQKWGDTIQLQQFGSQWSYIATHIGNTWFAYYGDQLSLRVFSLFPDSHSFPVSILLLLPAIVWHSFRPIVEKIKRGALKIRSIRAHMSIILFVGALFFLILSGTRGIWAASIGVFVIAGILILLFRLRKIENSKQAIFRAVVSYFLLFFLLFLPAWAIFSSPQFLVGKANASLFGGRIKSIVDFGETSNSQRIAIWKASITSIKKHPFFGVGIGNFPVVLDQRVELARAGSTAHNIVLHVAAEMGIFAMILAVIGFVWSWWKSYKWFLSAELREALIPATLLLVLPWVYAYCLTDPILFDERVFLVWGVVLALIFGPNEIGYNTNRRS